MLKSSDSGGQEADLELRMAPESRIEDLELRIAFCRLEAGVSNAE